MKNNINSASSSEERDQYRLIFESASDGMIIGDLKTGCVLAANPSAIAMHGYDSADFIGLFPNAYIHPNSQEQHSEALIVSKSKNRIRDEVSLHLRKDGSSFYADVRRTAIHFHDRPCMLSIIRDVSDRVNAENLLRQQVEVHTREQGSLLEISQTLASALELKPGLILDRLGVLVEYTHAELYVLDGIAMDAVAVRGSKRLEDTVPFSIRLKEPDTSVKLFNAHKPNRIPDVWSIHDPSAVFLRTFLDDKAELLLNGVRSWMWVPVAVKNRIIGSLGIAHVDASFFTAHHAELALTLANLAAIALINSELFEHAQELAALQERQRLAQNLHDAVNQSLFSAGLIADVLPRLWERDQEGARESLLDLRRLTRAAQAELRALLAELRPSAITETDLGDLLNLLGNALAGRINIPVSVTVAEDILLPSDIQVAFYRICQEALMNVAKHAKASHVEIDLQNNGHTISLHILDDGMGFNVEQNIPEHGHYGISMMRERAEVAGARVSIISQPGQGTELILYWSEDSKKEA